MTDINSVTIKYDMYLKIGQYYAEINRNLAYLSIENALFLSKTQNASEDEIRTIEDILEDYRCSAKPTVRKVSFVILSYNTLELTSQCVESIRMTCPEKCTEIVVVDNASTDGSLEWLKEQKDIVLVENKENVGFPTGCNQGIKASDPNNDIFLLNSDTLMMYNSLYTLRMGLYANELTGAVGATTNSASNNQVLNTGCKTLAEFERFAETNNMPSEVSWELKSKLIMFAMLIKRPVLDEVGLLDERFSPGFYEDDDYGFRIMEAGYHNILCWNSFIFHYGSKSFGKMPEKTRNLLRVNKEKFVCKWGVYPEEAMHFSPDFLKEITHDRDQLFSVLELGCGLGETLARIKHEYPKSYVEGVVNNKTIARLLKSKLPVLFTEDYWDIQSENRYDYIFVNGIWESLGSMQGTQEILVKFLKPGGKLVVKYKGENTCRIIQTDH